jgi:hypothetical protein
MWLPPWAVVSGDAQICHQAQMFLKLLVDYSILFEPTLKTIVLEMRSVNFFYPSVEYDVESCISYVDHARLTKNQREALEKLPQTLASELNVLRDAGRKLNQTLAYYPQEAVSRAQQAHERLLRGTANFESGAFKGHLEQQQAPVFVFLSHAGADKKLAKMISRELETVGIDVWRDDKDILPGYSIPGAIAEGLARASHFVLLHTRNSAGRRWVQTEADSALMLQHEQNGRPRIIPLFESGIALSPILRTLRGIPLDNLNEMLRELLRGVGIAEPPLDFMRVRFLLSRMQRLIEVVSRLSEVDPDSHLHLETFEELAEIEDYLQQHPLPPDLNFAKRFISTGFRIDGNNVEPAIDERFYSGYTNAIASSVVLTQCSAIAEKWAGFLNAAR